MMPPLDYSLQGKRIFVAGHRGLVGSALVRRLQGEDCQILVAGRAELDLLRQDAVERWMAQHRPQAVFIAAATVGGILANDRRPAEFLYDNLVIETNLIDAAHRNGVEKLMFLGSSCIYPRLAPQPMREDALLTGPLEPTNQWYAIAKIAGIMLCQAYRRQYGANFIAAMPTNLYGQGDNFDLQSSHVIPALIAKAHAVKSGQAKELIVWGSGAPLREFMYVDDLADALVFLMKHYNEEDHINVGVAEEVTIGELATEIARAVGVEASLRFDPSKPDGAPRKLMDSRRLFAMGWRPKTSLADGLRKTYAWYVSNIANPAAQK
ncbi:GDP-L-fucose synthase family protein [Pseudorhodoplanes sp.]|uniref:GDP-L-fucose synthase n=1 Tax=Pseudorhodoplanes sp. TaxID=1934341 RepID=UPI00391BA39B